MACLQGRFIIKAQGDARAQVDHVVTMCSVAQSCPTLCDPMAFSPQAPLSMGVSRQEYRSGLPCPVTMPRCNTWPKIRGQLWKQLLCPFPLCPFLSPSNFFFFKNYLFFCPQHAESWFLIRNWTCAPSVGMWFLTTGPPGKSLTA